MTEELKQIDGCIKFWESSLKQHRLLMEPTAIYQVEFTIKQLKELKGRLERLAVDGSQEMPE